MKHLIPALFLIFLSFGIYSQDYIVNSEFYGIEEGLSHRDVQSIHQDKNGMMWIGTNYGLNRFDGYNFKWYTREKHGLQSNIINHIMADDEGWMWLIFTTSINFKSPASIDLFNPLTEEVISLEDKFGDELPFKRQDILSFTHSKTGQLAFVTNKNQLITYTHKEGFKISNTNVEPLYLNCFSDHNTIWATSSKKDPITRDLVVEIGLDGKLLNRYEHDYAYNFNFIAGTDESDNMWYILKHIDHGFGSQETGKIFRIDPDGNEKEYILNQSTLPQNSVNLDIPMHAREYKFHINRSQGSFWLYGRNSLQIFLPEAGWHKELVPDLEWLAHTSTIYFDNRERAWIGTVFGLYVIELSPNSFNKLASVNLNESFTTFRAITQDFSDTTWACIDRGEGALNQFWEEGNHYKRKELHLTDEKWDLGYTYGIHTDYKGFIWFASGRDGVIKMYDPVMDTSQLYQFNIKREIGNHDVNVWSFHKDKKDNMWFGTDAGIIGYIDESHKVNILPPLDGLAVAGGCIYQFFEDHTGKIWLATDNGFHHLDPINKTTKRLTNDQLPFLEEAIYHVHIDSTDSFWLGTKGLGLIHWEAGSDQYEQFTKADGLSNNTIYAVYEDENQNLWLTSNYGIIQFNKNTRYTTAYLENDGITHNEFNRLSHYQSKDGKLFFGGLNGITAFHPKDLTEDSLSINTPMVLTSFQQLDGSQDRLIEKTKALQNSKEITLKPDDRFFRLEFALLTYTNIENVQYAYKIEGVDSDWTYQRENSVRFSRLPYGRHHLRVKGQLPNGQWSAQELSFSVIVLKPFYLQNWFILVMTLSFLLTIYLFYKWRIRNFRARQIELEQVVEERTRQISTDKKLIEKQAEELQSLEKLKSRFFANVSHELRTPLTLMLGPVNSLLKGNRQNKTDHKLLKFAQRNGRQLQKLINEILDLSKLENNKLEVVEEAVQFYPYLKEQLAQFHSFATSDQLKFELISQIDKSLKILLDKNKFEKIVHNFLSNAMKFTPYGGKVTLTILEIDDHLQLEVKDTGKGIHPEDLPYIFDRFYQSKQPDVKIEGGTGIGLSLCKELAELLNGRVWAESELGKGSTFYFKFPQKTPSQMQVENEISASDTPLVSTNIPDILEDTSLLETMTTNQKTVDKATILIVEDNNDLREYLRFILSDHRIITAENGKDAIEKLTIPDKPLTPDLIVSDLMMPVMDGFQLLERLKSDDRWRHLPTIMLTAKVNARAKLQALRIGVDDYLTKPFQEDELKARIENLLHNYRERMTLFTSQKNGEEEGATDEKPVIAEVDAQWLQEVEKVFSKQLSDGSLNIDYAADKLYISSRQLRRRLKQLVGLSPNQYLQEMRLQQAREHLIHGKYATIKEASYAVGFTDTKYFSNLFHKRFGTRPSLVLST